MTNATMTTRNSTFTFTTPEGAHRAGLTLQQARQALRELHARASDWVYITRQCGACGQDCAGHDGYDNLFGRVGEVCGNQSGW